MKNKALLFWRKNYIIITLSLIILLGAFLRLYHFSDWLHFELDQSRDAKVIDLALEEGIGNLPLLGPKAAGTFLRLGPAFYYFQYLSSLVFGGTPSGMAMIMALFGIGAIPLFYFLIKRYFADKLSLALTFLFSVSLFLVMYSRFSWNPNALPFFVLLTFLAMLRSVDSAEPNRNKWLVIFFVSLAIATQLHFLALVTLPAIAFFFFLARVPKIKWYFWIIGIAAALLFYFPPILNDIKTGGDNIGQFLKVAEDRSTKDDHGIASKLIKNYNEHALGFWLILSGEEKSELPRVIFSDGSLKIICDQECRGRLYQGRTAWLFFTIGILLMLLNFFRLRKEDGKKKDFLLLVILWFSIVFAFYTPIAFNLSPRFLLLIAPLPFIFLGFWIELLRKYFSGNWKYLTLILIVIAAWMNLRAIQKRFDELKKAPIEALTIEPDRILKEKTRMTLKQQYMIMDYIENIYRKNNYPIYINSDPQYRRSFLYHMDKRGIERGSFLSSESGNNIYKEGNYFLVYPTNSNWKKDLSEYGNFYEEEKKQFGTFLVFVITPKDEFITQAREDIRDRNTSEDDSGDNKRYTWEGIFSEEE